MKKEVTKLHLMLSPNRAMLLNEDEAQISFSGGKGRQTNSY